MLHPLPLIPFQRASNAPSAARCLAIDDGDQSRTPTGRSIRGMSSAEKGCTLYLQSQKSFASTSNESGWEEDWLAEAPTNTIEQAVRTTHAGTRRERTRRLGNWPPSNEILRANTCLACME